MPPSKRMKKTRKSLNMTESSEKQELEKNTDLILKDLEIHYSETIKIFLDEIENTKQKFRTKLSALILTLPMAVRNMTVKEFREKYSSLSSVRKTFEKNNNSAMLSRFLNPISVKQAKKRDSGTFKKVLGSKRKSILPKVKRASTKTGRILPSRPLASRKKTASTGDPKHTADDSYVEFSDDDEVFFTPSSKNSSMNHFITPKFDISKPLSRSLLRTAKPGERVLSLSGSPLLVEDLKRSTSKNHPVNKKPIEVTVGKKKYCIQEQGKLDEKKRKEMTELKKQIDEMLRK